jgi:hypothetical protein
MEVTSIHTIIEGCLVNNWRARSLLFSQVYTIGYPVARLYAKDAAAADHTVEIAFLYILENLSFYDSTRLGFKSWIKQVVTDKALEQSPPLPWAVFVLQSVEGFNEEDISLRLNIPQEAVKGLFRDGAAIKTADEPEFADPEREAACWLKLEPLIRARFTSDESVAMPFRARAKQRIADGGWIGWAVLIALSALAILVLEGAGIINGKPIRVRKATVTHVSTAQGYALPCPNH